MNVAASPRCSRRRHVRVDAREEEAAVGFEARDRPQVMVLVVEAGAVGTDGARLDPDVLAGAVVGPRMIGAGVNLFVTTLRAAQERALVAAAVDHAAQLSVAAAHHGQRIASGERGEEIVRARSLRLEPEKHPRRFEDVLLFEREDLLVGKDVAVHPEDAVGRTVVDQRFDRQHRI